ncbi:MAG: hypothetical protein E7603_02700 [Ruminococcaceae bacterium]|nr:hypothetical protein [Oscillospiraceae bacterium]
MRYFKYENTGENKNNALTEQYKTLSKREKQIVRKETTWKMLIKFCSTVIFFFCMMPALRLIRAIPQPTVWFWAIFAIIGKIILGLIFLIISGILTFYLTSPLWKKLRSFSLPTMKKEIFAKACWHLRVYYHFQEPYIITKCFDATDRKFKNHDVCIFFVQDELRITADLKNGFLHGERDLGCYIFEQNEISLSKQQNGKHLSVLLKTDDTFFLLGYRAKSFIEKNFT